jgi:hypothetical protein
MRGLGSRFCQRVAGLGWSSQLPQLDRQPLFPGTPPPIRVSAPMEGRPPLRYAAQHIDGCLSSWRGDGPGTLDINPVNITEWNRICSVPFDMNSRIFGPYLAGIHRILISVMSAPASTLCERTGINSCERPASTPCECTATGSLCDGPGG